MYLEQLAPSWREFHRKLLSQARLLIVDDEEVIQQLLSDVFGREGFTVVTATTAEEAWERVQNERLDLAVIDKNLPGESGLDLIERIRDADIALPSVLITGYASTETVAEALEKGASDYISKPFNDVRHLVARIRGVLDRRISKLLFDVIVSDLTKAMQMGGIETDSFAALSRELLAYKLALGRRPHVLIYDDDEGQADHLAATLEEIEISTVIADTREEVFDMVGRQDGPLVVVIALETANAIGTIRELRKQDPQLELLATAGKGVLQHALDAVSAGAADFVLRSEEGKSALGVRVDRLVQSSRRHRLYLHLVATLYGAAKEANPDLADDLVFAAGADRDYVESQPTAATGSENSGAFRLDVDFAEGDRIEGDPLGSRPLTRKPRQ